MKSPESGKPERNDSAFSHWSTKLGGGALLLSLVALKTALYFVEAKDEELEGKAVATQSVLEGSHEGVSPDIRKSIDICLERSYACKKRSLNIAKDPLIGVINEVTLVPAARLLCTTEKLRCLKNIDTGAEDK